MKINRLITFIAIFTLGLSVHALALKGILASEEDIARLKNDLLEGSLRIGTARLADIQQRYGEAPNIIDDDQRVTYDYGDLRLTFDRKRVWKSWEYDTFKERVYTDSVDGLRFDLESEELVGKNITYKDILKNYGIPTESHETDEDGGMSVYYYGDIRMEFENMIVVRSWRGTNLGQPVNDNLFSSSGQVFQTSDADDDALAEN